MKRPPFPLLLRYACYALLFSITCARADWVRSDFQSEPAAAASATHEHVVLTDETSGTDATLDIARFSPKTCRLRIVDNPGGGDLSQAMRAGNWIAGVNGGYFTEDFAPLGLRIDNRNTMSPLVRGKLMSGVISASGPVVRIMRLNEFSKNSRPDMAIQCGPFLVDRGQVVPGLNASKPARRTFVATTGSEVLLGFSSSVSLAQLSSILASPSTELKIQRALNLDGGSSSAFWLKRQNGSVFSISGQKAVRDFVAIAPR
jgi:uncharacterized protein YigE (DUF2233 family)